MAETSTRWSSAVARKSVEVLWKLWCFDAESYLCRRACLAGLNVDEKQCRGRGQPHFVKQRVGMPCDGDGCARSAKASKLGKLKRRLVDLLRQVVVHVGSGTVSTSAYMTQCLWDKCRRIGAYLVPDARCDGIWRSVGSPCVADLHALIACVASYIQKQQLAERTERQRIWKEKLVSDWNEGGAQVYRWCKGEENEPAHMISRPDGSLTCDAGEMDTLVLDAWLPIFQMYKDKPIPSWTDFKDRFGSFFAPRRDMHVDDLSGDLLREALGRMRSKSSPGCDGLRVDELKRLPPVLFNQLASLFNIIEDTRVWSAGGIE